MEELFSSCTDLIGPHGATPVAHLSRKQIVGLYFSANWCPPCRAFTPKLSEAYKKISAIKPFEVVFVSSDHDEAAFAAYHAEMPWVALPFAEGKLKTKLSKRFKISSIPALILLDGETGSVLSRDGCSVVEGDPTGKMFPWAPTPFERRRSPGHRRSQAGVGSLLPVTVLSGFLGAGKTTLLKHILRTAGNEHKPMCIAVIVNDMGEINLDASDIKHSKLIQEEATMVELTNGCICCTLRGDLLKTVKALSEEKAFDYLIIESTGISEPLPVAQTFVMDVDEEGDEDDGDSKLATKKVPASNKSRAKKDGGGDENEGTAPAVSKFKGRKTAPNKDGPENNSLSKFARLDTLVTVVDSLNIFDVLSTIATLAEENSSNMVGNTGIATQELVARGGESEQELDDRSIAQLMLDQIEFANVIVLSKTHLLGAEATVTKSVSCADSSAKKSARGHKQRLQKRILTQQCGVASAGAHNLKSNEAAILEVAALIKKLNPKARVIVPKQPEFADVCIGDFVNTHLFDMDEAQESAGWMAELAKESEGEGHKPETEEYGVGSVVFRTQERPFHPRRLRAILEGFGNYKLSIARAAENMVVHLVYFERTKNKHTGAGGGLSKDRRGANDGVFNGVPVEVLQAYSAEDDVPESAGRVMELTGSPIPYLAAVPREEWNEEDMEQFNELVKDKKWHTANGDRESEAVFIGVHLDKRKMLAAIQEALLTDAEFDGGAEVWRHFADPFFGGDFFELSADEEEEQEQVESEEEEEEEEAPKKKKLVQKKRKVGPAAKPAKKARKEDAKKRTATKDGSTESKPRKVGLKDKNSKTAKSTKPKKP